MSATLAKRIVIGYGTGRCGTKSLAQFLNQQPGFEITHEKLSAGWYQSFSDIQKAIEDFTSREAEVIGDIGFYWIHYLSLILREFEGSKAINLIRDDEEVIESFWSYKSPQDTEVDAPFEWHGYPFDGPEKTKDALALTVKRYRMMEHEVLKIYPASIWRMSMQDLNDPDKMNELLDWIGCDEHRILQTVHINRRAEILSGNARNINNGRLNFNIRRS